MILALLVISIIIIASLWIITDAGGEGSWGNPIERQYYVTSTTKVSGTFGTDGFSAEIMSSEYEVEEQREIDDLSWWDPFSQDLTWDVTLYKGREVVDNARDTTTIDASGAYMKTGTVRLGPMEDKDAEYKLEVVIYADGELADSTSFTFVPSEEV